MDISEFERLVEDALSGVPDSFRERLANVEVVVEAEPPPELLSGMGVPRGGTLLGLYQGVPLPRRGHGYGNVLPDRIVVYMGPILRRAAGDASPADIVREVVLHELGHYFGLSEDELRSIEGGGPR